MTQKLFNLVWETQNTSQWALSNAFWGLYPSCTLRGQNHAALCRADHNWSISVLEKAHGRGFVFCVFWRKRPGNLPWQNNL
jgi:hypothetical protein